MSQDNRPVAVITGGARRIGAQLVRQLYARGFRIVLHYRTSKADAQTLINELSAIENTDIALVQADLCHVDAATRISEFALQAFGRVDVLINNASAFYPTPVGEITEHDWQQLLGSNVQGPLFLTQALAPALKQHNGCIINLTDIHIQRPLPGHSVYCLAKSALASLTQSLAQELAPYVRVNAISPGAILWPDRALSEEQKAAMLTSIPLGRLGTPDAIAQAMLFLIDADYITGQILNIDGGRSISSNAYA